MFLCFQKIYAFCSSQNKNKHQNKGFRWKNGDRNFCDDWKSAEIVRFSGKKEFSENFFWEVHGIQLHLKGDLGENKATATANKSDEVFISGKNNHWNALMAHTTIITAYNDKSMTLYV